MLHAGQINQYQTDGFCVLDDILTSVEADAIIAVVERLSGALRPNDSIDSQQALDSDEIIQDRNFLQLVRDNRADAGHVFDTLIKIPYVNQIVYSKSLQNIAEQLLKSDLVLSSPSQMNLRADHPEEGRFLYPWHTDYSYNGSSSNSLVFWIPLQEVNLVNGALHLITGSHRFKSDIRYDENAIRAKASSAYFSIDNIDEALRWASVVRCPLALGQAVVFHSKLIHKSGANRSTTTRFALQSRWFDGLSTDAVKRKYRGGLDEGIHPSQYL